VEQSLLQTLPFLAENGAVRDDGLARLAAGIGSLVTGEGSHRVKVSFSSLVEHAQGIRQGFGEMKGIGVETEREE